VLLDFTCGDLLNWVFSVVFKPRIPSDDGAPQAFISLLSYEGYATWGITGSIGKKLRFLEKNVKMVGRHRIHIRHL
ncbi:MAG: hypothetical protein QNJ97_23960, partial [Myxococcota bacterium]|nr:hypothetical protein [Myxococcota bacterium]